MRVILGERHGAPEVLRIAEREAPRPGSGEVVVDVIAVGVNYLTRPKMADYTAGPEELRWRAGEVFDWIVKGPGGRIMVRSANGLFPLSDSFTC